MNCQHCNRNRNRFVTNTLSFFSVVYGDIVVQFGQCLPECSENQREGQQREKSNQNNKMSS